MTDLRPVDLPELRTETARILNDPRVDNVWDSLMAWGTAVGNSPNAYRKFFMNALPKSELYWVAGPMAELAQAGASSVPSFDLQPEDVPAKNGLLIFETPVTSMRSEDGEDRAEAEMTGLLWGEFNSPDGKQGVAAFPLIGDNMIRMPLSVLLLTYGEKLGSHTVDMAVYYKIMQTCWLLMQQQLSEAEDIEPDRASRKRMRRAGYEPRPIRVINLRRPKSSGAGDGVGNYHHQWIVRGHWRNHWHPKRQVHRPVWIAPHVKGPEGAPMIGGEKVYAWKK